MDAAKKAVSPALEEANRRLYQLRQQVCPPERVSSRTAESQSGDEAERTAEPLAVIPNHLGWGSERLTAVLRQRIQRQAKETPKSKAESDAFAGHKPVRGPNLDPEPPDWVKLYPDIGLGMLREGAAAPGRLWLMLRYLDQDGQGSFRIVNIREQLTRKKSAHRLCGKRQLRNLLRDGEGVYWTRDNGRLWLRSAAKVAFALGVEHLSGRPVALPVAAVLEGVGAFKAHLYAAFHSGRVKETPHGAKVMPIARETVAGLSGVGRSSQRNYEQMAGVEVQANFAVGEPVSEDGRQERAWRQGQALFELQDFYGRQGKKGRTYLCWQLPNSYEGGHVFRPRGRQRRINRELNDLVNKRAPGNEEGPDEEPRPGSMYYPNGMMAAKAYGRDPAQERYWRQGRVENGRFVAWQQLGGEMA